MRLLTTALAVMLLAQPAHAQTTAAQMILPSPVSIAITVGHWIMTRDNRKVFYVEVQSQAETFTAARAEGFRLAVEHAVGSLILSETEARNGRMTRDEITTYASGYVDRFEIVQEQRVPGGVQLQMKVWVAHSALANRLLNQSQAAGRVEGERVQAQIDTFRQERQSADRVLSMVLRDFPHRAFDFRMEPTQVIVDNQRRPHLRFQFVMSWNPTYLTALGEAVIRVNQRQNCSGWLNNCRTENTVRVAMNAVKSDPQAWFDDRQAWDIFHQNLILSQPRILVTIRDNTGSKKLEQCWNAAELDHSSYAPWYFADIGPGFVTVNGLRSKRFDGFLDISNVRVDGFDRVEIRAIRANQCPA